MNFMRKPRGIWMGVVAACVLGAAGASAQSPAGTGALEFSAYVSPTAAKPAPVRDFTFYVLTADDILHVPEFLLAYQRSNSGGVTSGIPKPKYKDADKIEHPEKYEKEHQDYLNALKKFIQSRPETVAGIELELDGINPAKKWAEAQNGFKKRVRQQ